MGKDTFDAVLASVPNAPAGRVTSRRRYEPKLKPGGINIRMRPDALTAFERATGICTKFGASCHRPGR